ncbi:hypothetical protein vseg_014043 [Gypsophila vaccaria]
MVKKDRRMRASYNGASYTTDPTCFFKLIASPDLLNKLRLPEAFANQFRDDLSEICSLRVPTGETHRVALVEENGHLWFRDGWERFVDRYSIGYGYFITFTYGGESKFRVSVFNLSACEISYQCHGPTASSRLGDVGSSFPEELDGRYNVGPGNSRPSLARRRNAGVEIVESRSEDDEKESEESSETDTDIGEGSKDGSQMDIDCDDEEMDSREGIETSSDTMVEGVGGSRFGRNIPVWLKPFKASLNDMIAAGISIPANPFFVAVVKKYNLNVPRAFALAYMNCRDRDSITIETCDGGRWVVRCLKSRLHCTFGKGWVQLCQNAHLELGDVCLLELTDAENLMLKLHVVNSS